LVVGRYMALILSVLVVDDGRLAFHVLSGPGLLLFEVIFLVDALNYLLVS